MTSTERTPRRTRQRTEIRDAVEASNSFATSQEIHDRMRHDGSTVGLATVYRALQAMAEADEVDVLRTPDGEAAYRRCSSGHHHHLVCRSCGFSIEIEAHEVEAWAAKVAAAHGFTDTGHELELFGLCRDCVAAGAED